MNKVFKSPANRLAAKLVGLTAGAGLLSLANCAVLPGQNCVQQGVVNNYNGQFYPNPNAPCVPVQPAYSGYGGGYAPQYAAPPIHFNFNSSHWSRHGNSNWGIGF